MPNPQQRIISEFIGTAFLLATVVGSGIMAERLSVGNVAIALLGNTIPTGAVLYVLITIFGPISGAQFNPAVTFSFVLEGAQNRKEAISFVAAQIAGAIVGVWCAHMMFDEQFLQLSTKSRFGGGQWFSEFIATFGLVLAIFLTVRFKKEAVAAVVACYIIAAYWFTASTSFANPAVTIARALSDTFAGIEPISVLPFVGAQLAGAACACVLSRQLLHA